MTPLLLSLALLLTSALYSQSTYFVKTTGNDNNNGTSWSSAFKTIRKALSKASAGDNILVAAGTYYPDEGPGASDNNRNNSFELKNGVSLYGGFLQTQSGITQRNWLLNRTILSGDIDQGAGSQASNLVVLADGVDSTTRLDGFFIMYGRSDFAGGGMYNRNSTAIIANCTFSSNWAYRGGGMCNDNAPVTIRDCNFEGNTGHEYGGGIYNSYSAASITRCSFTSNVSMFSESGGGAGIQNFYSSPVISHCHFINNMGQRGTAINNDHATVKIDNSVFRGNAAYQSGIINNSGSNVTIYGCTIWGNSGWSVFNMSSRSVVISNTILYGSMYILGSSVSVSYSLLPAAYPGTGNIVGDPKFKNASAGDLRLDICSPAFNTGNNAIVNSVETDLGKRTRIMFGRVDIGAYELQERETIIYVNDDATGANNGTSWANAFTKLQDAIAKANCSTPTQIWVAAGTYYPDEGQGLTDNNPYQSFQLKSGMEIYGNFAGTEDSLHKRKLYEYYASILSGDINKDGNAAGNSFHVVKGNTTDTTAILDGFTINGGNANAANEPVHQNGAGIHLDGASPKIYNCKFLSNSADVFGGAIYSYQSYPIIINSIFWQNHGGWGGGGIHNYIGFMKVYNCSFWGNTGAPGGAIRNVSAGMKLVNSILWGDQTELSNASTDLQLSHCIIQGGYFTGTRILNVDPQYINPSNYNLRPFMLSPAIDTGNNAEVISDMDIDGVTRIVDNKVDLGAYEYQGNIAQNPPDTIIDPILLTCPADFSLTSNEQCGAVVSYEGEHGVLASWDDGEPEIMYDPPEGSILPPGEHILNVQATGYVVHPGIGTDTLTASCNFKVFVSDLTSPVISAVTASDTVLYPPNHKMRDVYLNYTVMDNCSVDTVFLQVFSNEKTPANGASDWQIVNDHQVKLRAERLGTGAGREYGILITAIDHSGNAAAAFATVKVPHDKGNITTRVEPMEPEAAGLNVKVLPNPSSGAFNLFTSSASAELMIIRVLDNLGREVEARKNVPANGTIYFGEKYKPGVYFVQVVQGGEVKVVRVVKW